MKFLFTLSVAIIIVTACGFIFKHKKGSIIIQLILNVGKHSYFMYLNEAFIIGCVQKITQLKYRQDYVTQIIITILVIIMSYILSIVFNEIYKNISKIDSNSK